MSNAATPFQARCALHLPVRMQEAWRPLVRFTAELVRSMNARAVEPRLLAPDLQVDDVFEPARLDPKGHGDRLLGSLAMVGAEPSRGRAEIFWRSPGTPTASRRSS